MFNFGELEATAGGSLTIADPIVNLGDSLAANGGNLSAEGAVFGGDLDISSAVMNLGGPAYGAAVDFLTGGGELKLEDAPTFSGTVAGFAQYGNAIDLADIAYVAGKTTWSFTENAAHTSGVLMIDDTALGGPVVSLHLLGNLSAANIAVGPDGGIASASAVSSAVTSASGGTLISYASGEILT